MLVTGRAARILGKLLFLATLVLVPRLTEAAPRYAGVVYGWHTFLGGPGYDRGTAVATDRAGNVVVVGRGPGGWLGPGGELPLNPAAAGAENLFVAKFTRTGAYLWHTFHGPNSGVAGSVWARAVAIDGHGNILVAGDCAESWDGPAGEPPLHDHAGGGTGDIVVLKLTASGAYSWHTFFGSEQLDSGMGVAVDFLGNVVVAGESYANWKGAGGARPRQRHAGGAAGVTDLVVLKLSARGRYLWHSFYGSTGEDHEADVAVDRRGNVVLAGLSEEGWAGPRGEAPVHAHAGGDDLTVVKLSPRGTYRWHTFHGSAGPDEIGGVATDDRGSVLVAGSSAQGWAGPGGQSPVNAHAGGFDLAVLKLSGAGAYRWHTFHGSAGADFSHAVGVDPAGSALVAAASPANWLGPAGQVPLNAHAADSSWDITVLKLSAGGAYAWHSFHGAATSGPGDFARDVPLGVAIDRQGNVVTAGTSDTGWLGPSGEAPLRGNTGDGGSDPVVIKLLQERTMFFLSEAANDGWVRESSEESETGGALDSDGGYLILGDDARDRQYRSVISFRTAKLPDTAVVRAAWVGIRPARRPGNRRYNTTLGPLLMGVRSTPFSGDPALQRSDFEDRAVFAGEILVDNFPGNPYYDGGAVEEAALTQVNLRGRTQFILGHELGDDDDQTPDTDYYDDAERDPRQGWTGPRLDVTFVVP